MLLQRAASESHQVMNQHHHTADNEPQRNVNVTRTDRSLQEVLRRKDWDLLRLVGLLHRDAVFRSCDGCDMFHLRSA